MRLLANALIMVGRSSRTAEYEREDCAYGLVCVKGACKGNTGAPCETTMTALIAMSVVMEWKSLTLSYKRKKPQKRLPFSETVNNVAFCEQSIRCREPLP